MSLQLLTELEITQKCTVPHSITMLFFVLLALNLKKKDYLL